MYLEKLRGGDPKNAMKLGYQRKEKKSREWVIAAVGGATAGHVFQII